MKPLTSLWLVQRGNIIKPYNSVKGKKLSDAVDMDYMGSSEFEGGALAKSLRRFQENPTYTISIINFETVYKGENIKKLCYVFHYRTTEEIDIYFKESLSPLFFNKLRLQESARFGVFKIDYPGWSKYPDFWWDIENDIIWSDDKMFMKRLPDHLKASFEYMDRNK